MCFVPQKSVEQQDLKYLHRIRSRLVACRTQLINQISGLLAEYGIALPQHRGQVRRCRRRRRVCARARVLLSPPTRPNETWTMDFLHDALAGGRKFRTLSIEDAYTREMPVIEVDTSLPALRVVCVLERIVIDHGTEFTSKALDQWAYQNKVTLHFITPGRPMENGYIESFHGKFREECLNERWFLTLDDARETIENWRLDYNRVRPHSSLGYLTPEEFRMGYANVESKNSFPHLHSPECGGTISLRNSTASTLT